MSALLTWLRRLSASDTAVRAVEQSLLDWKYEVDEAPGVLGAFASDFRMASGIGRLIVGVVIADVLDALRGGWWRTLLLWVVPMMAFVVIAFVGLNYQNPLIWWWGLPVAALPYAAILTVARARTRPPALGMFAMIAALSFTQLGIWAATQSPSHDWMRMWLGNLEWLLFPAVCLLLADRLRREARPNRQLTWCTAVWFVGRLVQVQLLSYGGGVYRPLAAWIVVIVPAALWAFYVWKQERRTAIEAAEEVIA